MFTYLIMQNPGHSRVYYKQASRLALAELKIASKRFKINCLETELVSIANIFYISFKVEQKITQDELFLISRLSFIFALFELVEIDYKTLLVPILLSNNDYIDPKISSLLKYSGKTNELFTKMMINVGLLSSNFNYNDDIQLLDPIAGKGTTLFEGAVYGFDVSGIEINKKSFNEACLFFKKYLEKEKYKHKRTVIGGSTKSKTNPSDVTLFEYAATKDEFNEEAKRKKLKFVNGDTTNANTFFKGNTFHIIVGDLPYGIFHDNIQKNKKGSPSRNPLNLLSDCLSEWNKILKKDGVLVLAWNKFVLSKRILAEEISSKGFKVLEEGPYNDFEHKVDASIKRDIIVAIK